MNLRSHLLFFLTLLLAFPALPVLAEEGWHGEPMPEGLVRGEIEGEYIWQKDSSVMVYVPAGTFQLGNDDEDPDERPARQIHLDAYYIDKYEVSWTQWKSSGLPFSMNRAERRPLARSPDWGIVDEQPVLNVDWDDAREYTAWVGKNLPTEAQWEKAARGTDGRRYPWGNEEPTKTNGFAMWKNNPEAMESTAPVDSYAAGASPYGALHMAGNVYEWCLDVYARDFYARAPESNPVNLNEEDSPYRVLRGGAFVLEISDLRSALRYRLRPEDRTSYIGFRTVLNPEKTSSKETSPKAP